MWRDHPRMGGEKDKFSETLVPEMGSPPRGRGKVEPSTPFPSAVRITPAWAGKRLSPVTPYNPPSDHPRMGGEKAIDAIRQQ